MSLGSLFFWNNTTDESQCHWIFNMCIHIFTGCARPQCALYSMCAFKVQTITIQYSNRYSMLNEQPNSQSQILDTLYPYRAVWLLIFPVCVQIFCCSTIYIFYLLINRIKKNSIDNSFGVTSLIHWVEIDRIMWMLTLFFRQ